MAQNKTTPRQNDDLLDSAWRIYKDAQDLIKFADRKINILLIISGVMITFVFNQVGTIKASGDMAYVALAAFLVALSLFLLFSLLALFSRKEAKSGIGVSQLIFFGHIGSRKSADEYYEIFKDASSDSILRDLCFQIHGLGIITTTKYTHYKRAWWALCTQILTFIALIWIVAQ